MNLEVQLALSGLLFGGAIGAVVWLSIVRRRAVNNKIDIQWMNPRHHSQVLEIEQLQSPYPWTEEDFTRVLNQRNANAHVAVTPNGDVLGFVIYGNERNFIDLWNMAVHPSCERRGVGAALVQRLKQKLTCTGRSTISLWVSDWNLRAQLFFAAQGFKCTGTVRNAWQGDPADAYVFSYRLQEESPVSELGNVRIAT